MRSVRRIKGLGFILWHGRHELYHVFLGLVWSWFLRDWWHLYNSRFLWWSLFGSLLPDIDHIFYFFLYGKRETYANNIRMLLRSRQWRNLVKFIESGHKQNTALATHNIYVVFLLCASAALSSLIEWRVGVVIFGAMVIHYIFDIVDDIVLLGKPNPNWRHLRRIKESHEEYRDY